MLLSLDPPDSPHDGRSQRRGRTLRRIRAITNQFALPENACMTYQSLYRSLKEVEKDLHRHIHLETTCSFRVRWSLTKCHREKVA